MLGSKKKLEAEPIHSVSDDPQYVAVRDNLSRLRARHAELIRMDREILQQPEPPMTEMDRISREASQLTVEGQLGVAIETPGPSAASVRREREILEVAIGRESQNLSRHQQRASQKVLAAMRPEIVEHCRQLTATLFNLALLGIHDAKLRCDLSSRGASVDGVPLRWLNQPSTMRTWSPCLTQVVRGMETALEQCAAEVPELRDEIRVMQAELREAKQGYDG